MIPQNDSSKEVNGDVLSEANLSEHNDAVQEDTDFTENQIGWERTREYEQAFGVFSGCGLDSDSNDEGSDGLVPMRASAAAGGQGMSSIVRQYGTPNRSNAPPMQRFCTLTTADEPNVLTVKLAMERIGVGIGSLETLNHRTRAARIAAGLAADEDDPLSVFVPDEGCRNAGSGGRTRVKKDVRMKKRKNGNTNDDKDKRQKQK